MKDVYVYKMKLYVVLNIENKSCSNIALKLMNPLVVCTGRGHLVEVNAYFYNISAMTLQCAGH